MLAESVLLFITYVCIFVLVTFINKDIEDLRYHINLIKEVDLEVARTVDTNFDIVDRQIEELKGPIYGPMIEEGEEYTE